MADVDITPLHLSWIVDGRSANQLSTMSLYRIIYDADAKLNANAELHDAAQELAGIAFSLWRSVFLSDTSGEFEDQTADVRKFLVSLISDNAILYITDKNARNWSFRYYLNNAIYRLEHLSQGRLELVNRDDMSKPVKSEKDEWFQAQALFDSAVQKFGALVK